MNGQETTKVLLLEDDSEYYQLIAKQLRAHGCGFVIEWADTLAAAVLKLQTTPFDVILADLSLPDSSGMATVAKLKAEARELPVIVLTSLDDECVECDILTAGAQDYLIKGELNGRAMSRTILHAIQRQQMRNEVRRLLSEREESQRLLERQTALLKKKNRRLRKLYKTAQEFVDNVSHDFRTPLTVIKDYVSIIREGIAGDINEEQQAMLDKVNVRADDLNHMVDDLLDVSKLEAGLLGAWRRNVTIYSIVERIESMLRQRAQVRRIELTIECEPDLPEVYCDADMVARIITNLAVNAIKFSQEGTSVRLWVQADPTEYQVVVGITDTGPGIDDESLGKIFERFSQLENHSSSNIKGFGLGLNIAYQLCRINLGELSVQSSVGRGSTFSFTIPIAYPTEVLRRWLKSLSRPVDALQMIEINVDSDAAQATADDFDSFLNCLLRKNDLLFRVQPTRWLLLMAAPSSESDRWHQRAQEEFRKHNPNRPMGPLPNYRAEVRGAWNRGAKDETVIAQFNDLLNRTALSFQENR